MEWFMIHEEGYYYSLLQVNTVWLSWLLMYMRTHDMLNVTNRRDRTFGVEILLIFCHVYLKVLNSPYISQMSNNSKLSERLKFYKLGSIWWREPIKTITPLCTSNWAETWYVFLRSGEKTSDSNWTHRPFWGQYMRRTQQEGRPVCRSYPWSPDCWVASKTDLPWNWFKGLDHSRK